ncbi:MAG: hypothetical protein IPP07_15445 [Holophagales bacterium]|nr:hypothetical protein [Holophagales bacterium]
MRPLLGFSYSNYAGPGLSTYHVGQDEFQMNQELKEKDTEFRLGVAFDAGPVSGQVVRGGVSFRGRDVAPSPWVRAPATTPARFWASPR